MLQASDYPISVQFDFNTGTFDPVQIRDDRKLSDLQMMFHDKSAIKHMLERRRSPGIRDLVSSFETSNSDMSSV